MLIVEDSEDDADLMLRELTRGGYEPTSLRVETADAMEAALDRQAWDIVISDYVLPSFSGLDALRLVQQRRLDVPFIVVSGKIGEDVAVEAMRAGAHDYLMKDRLARLPAAAEWQLAQGEERRKRREADEALRRANRALEMVRQINQQLVRAEDETRLLDDACRVAVEVGGYRMAWVGFAEEDEAKTVRPVAWAGVEQGYLEGLRVSWADTGLGRDPTGTTIRIRESVICRNILQDPDYVLWRADAFRHGFASLAAFPLIEDDHAFGALSIYASEWNAFDGEEIRLLSELADDLAYGIASLRLRGERGMAEAALAASEANYRAIFDAANDAIFVHDTETGAILDVNRKMTEMYGYTPEEARRVTVEALSSGEPPYTQEDALRLIRKAVEGQPQILEWRARNKAGEMFWVEVNLKRASIAGRDRLLGIVRDITERKRAEETMARLASFPELNPNPVFEVDCAGQVIYANPSAVGAFPDLQALGAEHPLLADLESLFAAVKSADKPVLREVRIGESWYEEFGYYVPQGQCARMYTLNITERKAAEENLRRLTENLRGSNEELQQFAYVASHDLQEPLRMVGSYVQLLAKRYQGRLDKEADEFIGYAVEGVTRMQQLINDLLQYSRVGTRGQPFEPTDCEAVLAEAESSLKTAIGASGAEITHDPLPTVVADRSQLGEVLRNLIGNAIKFRREEPPRIHVSAVEKASEWVFSVRDNGIGIAPEHIGRLFKLFERLHSSGEYPGTGIGLAICKRIVERHGGRIWVESKEGEGSTFHFTMRSEQGDSQADLAEAA